MNWNRNSRSYNLNEAFVLDETLNKGNKEIIRERRRSDSLSSVEDDDPVTHPRGLPTKAHSIDFGLDEVEKRKPCGDCLLGCFVVFFVLALLSCVAIILYFVLINTAFAERETKTLTGALAVEGSLLLNETYDSDLANPQSMAYTEMENIFLSSMNASFSSSTLADVYDGAKVERFEEGSVRIVFTIFLLSAPNGADTEADVILEVRVTIGDGIVSGFFDDFDVVEDTLEITSVNQDSRTTTISSATVSTEAVEEQSSTTAVFSVASEMMSAVSTLLSTSLKVTETVTASNKLSTTRQLSTHVPASPTVILVSNSTSMQSATSTTFVPTTETTTVQNSSSAFNSTPQRTTVPSSSTDFSDEGTTTTTPSNLSTTSSTTVHNATGSFNLTAIPTTIPSSPTASQMANTFNTTPSITRMISATIQPTAPQTSSTSITNTTTNVALTNDALTNLTTTPLPSSDSPTSMNTPSNPTTPGITSSSPGADMNITRQPKIHPALPDICGVRPAWNVSDDGTARIVGGTQSTAGSWPWMGSLRQGNSHQCGAVLIHPEWAITAHHCIGFFDNIILGDIDLFGNTNTSPYRVQRFVQTFSNPDFNPVTEEGDIALVRLTEPVEFNDYVQPLCINTFMTEIRSFNNCYITGWGTDDIDHQVAMRYLQEASIQLFDRANCSEWYQNFHVITNQHICAGEEDGRRDACSGDSGGPLQCQDDQGIWYLLGVVSFGQDCGLPRLPGVYTRISTQISFLSQILDTNIK